MNKVEKVSIGGYAFTLDENAYSDLSAYLDELKSHYSQKEGGSEILEGIEERMAELLIEKLGSRSVVSAADAEEVMDILGKPETIEESDNDEPGDSTHKTGSNKINQKDNILKKKLFRDMKNAKLCGVCSGLADYFNISVTFIRLCFALAFILLPLTHNIYIGFPGSMLLIYLLLVLIIPKARTVEERHSMRGEGSTVNDIQQMVENGMSEARDTVRDIGKSDAWKQIWNALVIAIGIVLILIGFAGLFVVSVCVFANSIIGFDELLNYQLFRLIEHTPEIANLWKEGWVKCLAIAAAVLPFTGMLTSGVQLVSGYKCKKFRPGLIIFILWLMTLLALAILVVLCLL